MTHNEGRSSTQESATAQDIFKRSYFIMKVHKLIFINSLERHSYYICIVKEGKQCTNSGQKSSIWGLCVKSWYFDRRLAEIKVRKKIQSIYECHLNRKCQGPMITDGPGLNLEIGEMFWKCFQIDNFIDRICHFLHCC